MKKINLLLLLLFPVFAFSQNFIGKSKTAVKKELQQMVSKSNNPAITLSGNDSVLVYSIKDNNAFPADFIYSFDKSGKCQSEKVMAANENSFTKYRDAAISEKKYGWKKINENQYVSNYASHMMIELPAERKDFFYQILKTEWTKDLYDLLTGN